MHHALAAGGQLARFCPAAKVDPSVLCVDDDPVITSAGTAAGIDACLYLVRREQGSRVANAIARRMRHRIATAGRRSTWSGRSLTRRPVR